MIFPFWANWGTVNTAARAFAGESIPCCVNATRFETYLERFRPRIQGADRHDGVWASDRGQPLSGNALYGMLVKRTKDAFGFSINPHRFRHAAATFWSIHDPANVRGVKDLLGQETFDTTDTHYIMGQSRLAGRAVGKTSTGCGNSAMR